MSLAFAIAQAVTVRMGHLLGQGDTLAALRTSYSGMLLSISTMLIVAIGYWVFPAQLIAIDLNPLEANNAKITTIACEFLAICAIFQILDSIRIVLFGEILTLV